MKNFFYATGSQFRSLNRPAKLLLLANLFDGLFFAGWGLFFNLYMIEAGYSRDFLGLANAVPSLAALLLGIPMGLLSDRIGRKPSMLIGYGVAGFACIGMILSRTEWVILALAMVLGAIAQLWSLSQTPLMMKVSDDKTRNVLFSLSFGMFPLASTAGIFLAGYLPETFTHWFGLATRTSAYQAALLFSALGFFLPLIPIAFIREPKAAIVGEENGSPKRRTSIWKVLLRPLTLKLSLPNLAIGLGTAMIVPYFNVFFAERYQMSDSMLGILFSAGSLAAGLACIVGPRLVDGLGGKVRTIILGQAASIGFLLAIGFSPWAWLAALGFLARGALMTMVTPLFDAFALEQSHETEHGAVNSVRSLARSVGWMTGAYLSGVVQQRWGFTPLFISTAALYAIATGLMLIFFRPQADHPLPVPIMEEVPS